MGKTQLAAHYAETLWDRGELDLLVWITAVSRNAVLGAYASAAEQILNIGQATSGADERFLSWLAGTDRRWLVVLDDLTVVDDLTGLWPPETQYGNTLVTTRRRDAALTGRARSVDVGVFTEREATSYLAAALAANQRSEPEPELHALAEDLGFLPLALAQAAAYIVDAHIGCAHYRSELRDRAQRLAGLAPYSLPDEQSRAVAATWDLSIDRAEKEGPPGLTRPVLQCSSLLDPNGIPETVFFQPTVLDHVSRQRERAHSAPEITARTMREALRVLHRLNLIDHNPDSPHLAIRVHQLIQRVTRDSLLPGRLDELARAVADALLTAWPDNERDTDLALALRANTAILTGNAEEALHRSEAHPVLYCAGDSLGHTGQFEAAAQYFEHFVDTCRRRLGPLHPSTLTARHHLGDWQGEVGEYGEGIEAVDTLEALLNDMTPVLGPDHPDTLNTRRVLANCRAKTEGPPAAFAELERLLNDMVRVLGRDHPHTLTTRRLLAGWQEDLADAIDAHVQLLPDLERVLGPDHLETLVARSELAHQHSLRGEMAEALEILEEVVPHMIRALGPTHPYTLKARNQLGRWQGTAGYVISAIDTYEELLEDLERAYGPDHPDIEVARNNLDHWYWSRQPPWLRDDWMY
ncbi:tetratricopeptide repeat protein [Streptomyces sp. NPDC002680]|uniref:tetratricopeptide repeat protein n=1 Tax=Streptomyces sp. NPDC002680 TaxID=3364659 RepID=UPI0036ACBC69